MELIDPRLLKPHPLNTKVYGDGDDPILEASIKEDGILNPLIVTEDLEILSGHQRQRIAIGAGMETVPVITVSGDVALEMARKLIVMNSQREKTNEQRTREYRCLLKIEERIIGERKKKGGVLSAMERSGAGHVAATTVGFTRDTAEKASEVLDKAESLDEDGHPRLAKALTESLNEDIEATHEMIQPPVEEKEKKPSRRKSGPVVPPKLEREFANDAEFKKAAYLAARSKKIVEELSSLPSGGRLPSSKVIADLENARRAILFARPCAVCPTCSGEDGTCPTCGGLGFITSEIKRQLDRG